MPDVYSVRIKFADDGDEYDTNICETDCTPEEWNDEDIFFYGISRDKINAAVKNHELMENEWYITEFYGIAEP